MIKVTIICLFFVISYIHAITVTGNVPQKEDGSDRSCDFFPEENYSASDLLQCMNDLASKSILIKLRDRRDRTSQLSQERKYDSIPSDKAFVGDNYYKQGTYFPPGNYPPSLGTPASDESSLFDALSSISQYDDLKCVPRILCEFAAGVTPGKQDSKQISFTSFDDFRKNALIGLLTAFDVSKTSPVLSFAKAALLGYANKGNSRTCYQEYNKCPRNPNEVVHYLNNHNGGFFRFFSGIKQGNYQSYGESIRGYFENYQQYLQGDQYYGREDRAGSFKLPRSEYDRTGTGKLQFDLSSLKYQQNFFPDKNSFHGDYIRRIVFPKDVEESEDETIQITSNRVPKGRFQNPLRMGHFFPQDEKEVEDNIVHLNSDFQDLQLQQSQPTFRFP